MAVMREAAQIVRGYLDEACGMGAAENPVLKDAGEEAGKDRDDV
jgi:hypothetical protein